MQCNVLLKVIKCKVQQVVNLTLLDHFFVVVLRKLAKEVNQFGSQRRPVELLKDSVDAFPQFKAACWFQQHQLIKQKDKSLSSINAYLRLKKVKTKVEHFVNQ